MHKDGWNHYEISYKFPYGSKNIKTLTTPMTSSSMEMQKKDLIRPILLVNEPFIGNAAAYLRDFCGFTVKSRIRKKRKEYIVSLPV